MSRQLSTRARASALVAAIAIALVAPLSVPAHAADETRSISGTVTLPAGAPDEWLGRIWVVAVDSSGASAGATLASSTDGIYTIDDLAPGLYRVRFRTVTRDPSNNWLEYWTGPLLTPTYWPDRTEHSYSVPQVDVRTADARGIDRALEYSGAMSGTLTVITESVANPSPSRLSVFLKGERGSVISITPSGGGGWTAPRIPADTYTVSYAMPGRGSGSIAPLYPDVADEYYDGVCHTDDMKPVVVDPGATTAGIDTTLEPRVYTDIPGTPFEADIRWLATTGVTTGYRQRDCTYLFKPHATITRDAMAAFLYRYAGWPSHLTPNTPRFADVAPATSMFTMPIDWLASRGISTGWTVGSTSYYRPFAPVTRDAMAAFLYRSAGSPAFTMEAGTGFTDVRADQPFAKEIAWLAATGISTGWSTGTGREFRPYAPVTREAMAAFLHRLDGLA